MSFAGLSLAQLWPLFAAGGGAITVLYLLRMRRRQVVVPFAALWERVTRESESRRLWRRLRRLLSWLLQMLVLALVCLALGDPRPEVWLRDPISLAIVIDTSASMAGPAADEPDTTRLDLARRRAEQEILALGPADRAVVLEASEELGVVAPLSSDPASVVPRLQRLTPRFGEADLPRALALASHAVGERPGPRILVLTDGALDPGAVDALRACTEGPIPCEVARVGGPAENVAITAFAARRYPYARDQIEVLTEVRNLGDTPVKVVLEIEADDAAVGKRTLHLPPGESKREVLAQLDAARSRFVARLRHEDGSDAPFGLPHDDEAHAVVPPLSPLDVVLVTDGTNLFLEAALLVLDDHVRLTGISPQEAREGRRPELAEADVVFFDVGSDVLPSTLPDAHVVMFDPWRHQDQAAPCPIAKKADVERPFLTEQDRDHPVLDHVVLKDVNLARGTTFDVIPGDEILVRTLGDPIAVLREGEHALVAFGFDPRQSDLPMRTAFPMVVDNLVRYFEQREAGFVASVPLGAHRELALADLGLAPEGVTRVTVRGPGPATDGASGDGSAGSEFPVERGRFRLRALVPGFYTITAVDGPLAGSSVELAVNQASVHASDLHDALQALELPEAAVADAPPEPTPLPQGPLWTLVMLVVASLVALEWASYHRRVTV
ncbi:vWA domain-containing protein [Paraliomyxa miuraensis]|uniref:vWA domain-containing protein n=1 Tax=Paraliomyxa miuraensis TaxID=376150 RepID=UPI00224DDCD8|nr:VWA domain-containing protein [Paraliomyxa miuraensis]MCX4240099.1 VWA domain-containing protein [Paraliomyxa miuraensis]